MKITKVENFSMPSYYSFVEYRNEEGNLHREDGPAYLGSYDLKKFSHYYYINGKLHRENDLPAVIKPGGYKKWYFNDKLHRLNGPASKGPGYKYYYFHGEFIDVKSLKEFKKVIKLMAFK